MPFSRGLPDPWIKPTSLSLLHWQASSLPLPPPGPCWYQKLDSLSSIPLTILLLKKKKKILLFFPVTLSTFSQSYLKAFLSLAWWLSKKSAYQCKEMQETLVRSLGQKDLLKEKKNPPQYSCLGNPMDKGV